MCVAGLSDVRLIGEHAVAPQPPDRYLGNGRAAATDGFGGVVLCVMQRVNGKRFILGGAWDEW